MIALLWTIPLLILRPFQNTPFSDDWVYGWSVEHLLRTHTLKILDIASSVNPVQVLWGALFCVPTGFSFTMLRASTWTLSTLGLCGLYLGLREIGVARRPALFATATLAVFPVYVTLSYSFMTDVPFVVCLIWFTYATLCALRTGQMSWLGTASLFAALAIGVRPVGVVLALVLPIVIPWRSLRWPQRRIAATWSAVPWMAAVLVLAWYSTGVEKRADLTWIEGSPAWRTAQLKYGLTLFPQYLSDAWWFCTGALGVALAPLILGQLSRNVLRRALVVLLITLGMYLLLPLTGGHIYVPLHSGETWSFVELSGTEHNYPGAPLPEAPLWFGHAIVPIGALLFALAAGSVRFRSLSRAAGVHLLLIAGQFLLMAIVWLFGDDRYILPLIPPAVALVTWSASQFHWKAWTAGLLGFALISGVGERDHLRYNDALWSAVAYLQDEGAPAREIDGGWEINGWLQYAHPENAAHDANGNVRVNWVNERTVDTRFRLAKAPQAGWTVQKTFPYTRWASRSGAIYVLTH